LSGGEGQYRLKQGLPGNNHWFSVIAVSAFKAIKSSLQPPLAYIATFIPPTIQNVYFSYGCVAGKTNTLHGRADQISIT
jgi:hypothetical protein